MTTIAAIVGRFGLDNALLRFVAASAAENDWNQVAALYRHGISLATTVAAGATVLVMFCAPWIASVAFSEPELTMPLRVMALGIIPIALLNLHAEMLKALRRVAYAVLVQSVGVPLLSLLLLPHFAGLLSTEGAVIAYVVATLCVLVIALAVWRKTVPPSATSSGAYDGRPLTAASLPLLVVAIMNVVIDMTDTIMIGIFLESEFVGIYGVAIRITALSSMFLTAVNSVVGPAFSSLWNGGKRRELTALARLATLLMAAVAAPILVLFLGFSSTIMSFFGEEFAAGRNALSILALGQFFALATGPVAYLLMMTGHEKFHRNNVIASAGLNIVLNAIFIPAFGITGAAMATAISLTIKNVVALIYVRRKLSIRVWI